MCRRKKKTFRFLLCHYFLQLSYKWTHIKLLFFCLRLIFFYTMLNFDTFFYNIAYCYMSWYEWCIIYILYVPNMLKFASFFQSDRNLLVFCFLFSLAELVSFLWAPMNECIKQISFDINQLYTTNFYLVKHQTSGTPYTIEIHIHQNINKKRASIVLI